MEDNQVKIYNTSKICDKPSKIYDQPKCFDQTSNFFQVKIVDDMQPTGENMPYMKAEDAQYFQKLLVSVSC